MKRFTAPAIPAASSAAATGKKYLSTLELADLWSVHPGTLRNWRAAGTGPKATKLGRTVRYKLSAVAAYERRHL